MALQGTLDTFELPDVLRLLASTKKTGRLHVQSDRGAGDAWLHDGQIVGVEAGHTAEPADALFELLRAHEGSFAFEPGEAPASPSEPAAVEPLLVEAESTLSEWRAIEAVVPSRSSWVGLAPELAAPEVTVGAETWRLVATVGSGMTVGELAEVLGLGEVPVSRLVRDLVELGLGTVSVPPAHAAPTPVVDVVAAADADVAPSDTVAAAVEAPDGHEPTASEPPGPLFASTLAPAPYDDPSPVAAEPAEVAPVVPAEALADPAEGDENRGLLLKFLSSVKT